MSIRSAQIDPRGEGYIVFRAFGVRLGAKVKAPYDHSARFKGNSLQEAARSAEA